MADKVGIWSLAKDNLYHILHFCSWDWAKGASGRGGVAGWSGRAKGELAGSEEEEEKWGSDDPEEEGGEEGSGDAFERVEFLNANNEEYDPDTGIYQLHM